MNSRRILLLAVAYPAALFATETDTPVREALNAGARWDSRAALNLSEQADAARTDGPLILQKIARQHSDLEVDQSDDPVSMLSVAVG